MSLSRLAAALLALSLGACVLYKPGPGKKEARRTAALEQEAQAALAPCEQSGFPRDLGRNVRAYATAHPGDKAAGQALNNALTLVRKVHGDDRYLICKFELIKAEKELLEAGVDIPPRERHEVGDEVEDELVLE